MSAPTISREMVQRLSQSEVEQLMKFALEQLGLEELLHQQHKENKK